MGPLLSAPPGAAGAQYGVRWQSEAATPLSACREAFTKAAPAAAFKSAVDAALRPRTLKRSAGALARIFGLVLTWG